MLRRVRFIASITALYALTLGAVGYLALPSQPSALSHTTSVATSAPPTQSRPTVISGKPVRITIPEYNIDLRIDEGVYSTDGSWTLSDTNAQFALISTEPNNHAGNTFIYGHGTDEVFGKLAKQPIAPGTAAHVHTATGALFSYLFEKSHDTTPEDTKIFEDTASGPPRLTIQTCTGIWSEWRTMFSFTFDKVEKDQK